MENERGTTVAEAKVNGWTLTAWCVHCRRGKQLDLLALEVAGKGRWPLGKLYKALRCHKCRRPASELHVSRMNVGKTETVCTFKF